MSTTAAIQKFFGCAYALSALCNAIGLYFYWHWARLLAVRDQCTPHLPWLLRDVHAQHTQWSAFLVLFGVAAFLIMIGAGVPSKKVHGCFEQFIWIVYTFLTMLAVLSWCTLGVWLSLAVILSYEPTCANSYFYWFDLLVLATPYANSVLYLIMYQAARQRSQNRQSVSETPPPDYHYFMARPNTTYEYDDVTLDPYA